AALWDELEEALISADVGATLTHSLIDKVKARLESPGGVPDLGVKSVLQDEIVRLLESQVTESPLTGDQEGTGFSQKPYVVLMVGVNGVGKTTSIAKLAHKLSQDGKKVLLAAGDTFRAAAIEQLDIWGSRTDSEVIAHQQGSDPGSVVFDALVAAKARGSDVVIIDTAGRLHTKVNLMEELKKIYRVIRRFDSNAPHETMLVLDATTGQNGLVQAKHFKEAVDVSSLLLAKLDGTAKGGVVLAIAEQLEIPIRFVGVGEQLGDLVDFNAEVFVEALFSTEG
ncbi:signal recognition particle-docking protein FtsY, partial [Dehalococcoidia bacterium]|nr:signal recognition particle-docking protein FtsY [Dehalococcoidia bacterium]